MQPLKMPMLGGLDVETADPVANQAGLGPGSTLTPFFVDRDEQDGWTALNIAAQNGHTSAVALLLEKGASVEQANKVN